MVKNNVKIYKILLAYLLAVILQLFKLNILFSLFISGIFLFFVLKKKEYSHKISSIFFMGNYLINAVIHCFVNDCEFGMDDPIYHVIVLFIVFANSIYYSKCIYNEIKLEESKMNFIKQLLCVNFIGLVVLILKCIFCAFVFHTHLQLICIYLFVDILICGIVVLLMYIIFNAFFDINKSLYMGTLIPIIFIPFAFVTPIYVIYQLMHWEYIV